MQQLRHKAIVLVREDSEYIGKKISDAQLIIFTSDRDDIGPRFGKWYYSVESVIAKFDPLGIHSNVSLLGSWNRAKLCQDGSTPSVYGEYIQVVHQLIGVLDGLINGHASSVSASDEPYTSKACFHTRPIPPQDNLVFVLMPFTEQWSDTIWKEIIKNKIESIPNISLMCRRADDLFGQDVMKDIYESILAARIIVADITERNANVFYELGMAHAFGKDVILLSQSEVHIPFDLNRFRHCIYSNDAAGYQKLTEFLEGSVKSILDFQGK